MNSRGLLVVLSGPSGAGKSTIIRALMKRRHDLVRNISTTTRTRRPYESDGVHYCFVPREQFLKWAEEGRFLEWEEVHGELYGTDKNRTAAELGRGNTILFDIDVKGGASLLKHYPDRTMLIFLFPPSIEELRRRLKLRGSDDEPAIERRISRFDFEKSRGDGYPFQLVNDDLESTVNKVLTIINEHSPIQE